MQFEVWDDELPQLEKDIANSFKGANITFLPLAAE